jgi:hypothetical protein
MKYVLASWAHSVVVVVGKFRCCSIEQLESPVASALSNCQRKSYRAEGLLAGGARGAQPPRIIEISPNTDILFTVAGFPSRARALCETPALVDPTRKRSRGLRTGGS